MNETRSSENELVVLVHGWASHVLWLRPLENRLAEKGHATLNWGYRSLWRGIEHQAGLLRKQLTRLAGDGRRLHLVAHSMGAIIVRCALAELPSENIGRVVMLGPPNRGSVMARRYSLFGFLLRPLRQLSDAPESFVNGLEPPRDGLEFGVIAGEQDHLVSIDATHLPGQTDHIVVKAGHNGMLFHKGVADVVDTFLRTGSFEESRTPGRAKVES